MRFLRLPEEARLVVLRSPSAGPVPGQKSPEPWPALRAALLDDGATPVVVDAHLAQDRTLAGLRDPGAAGRRPRGRHRRAGTGQALPGDLLLTQACLALLLVAVLVALGWQSRWTVPLLVGWTALTVSATSPTTRRCLRQAQICLAYVLSGRFKLQGAEWRDGSAVYYTLLLP
ncbi:hypothetical protein [Promicromonospora sp. NPDC060271]|uniref:hypothetical protein n=1 Tax=Promicromonospora sp. NPDC060271 TaxID=3347089 RepID=UPI00364B8B1C